MLGGGFAGVGVAQELARLRRRRPVGRATIGARRRVSRLPELDVVLVSRDNYFVFQPLLADIISGSIETTHVVVPLRRMLPRTRVLVGEVDSIDTARKRVTVRRVGGQGISLEYDALVLALGSVTDFRAVPGMAEHSIGVRTLGDAFYLRNRALDMLEAAAIEADPDRRRRLLTFVVVGGGSTGVEVAAELRDLLDLASGSFRATAPLTARVVLVHSRSHVLSEFGDRLGRYATRRLRAIGVELVLSRRLARVEAESVILDDGTSIAAGTVVSTVGNAPNPALRGLPAAALDEAGWVRADAAFAVPGLDAVWALGDCATITDPITHRPMPATAQHAIREGPVAAHNIVAALDGRPPSPFHYGQLGMLVSLGRRRGVGEITGVRVSGLVAWFLWRSYYLLRLPTLERRIRVAIDWTLDLFLTRDIVEINVRRTVTRPGETPGELGGEPVSAGAREGVHEELVM